MQTEHRRQHIPYRPLGLVKEVIENVGAQVSYVYEDLVFIDHNSFLLQFGEAGTEIIFYRNTETAPAEAEDLFRRLCGIAGDHGLNVRCAGSYSLRGNDDETLSLEFFESSS